VDYPPVEDEVKVIQLVRREETAKLTDDAGKKQRNEETSPAIPQDVVFQARAEIAAVHVSDAMERYMADLVYATRTPAKLSEDLARWIEVGGSPRASLAFDKCGRAHAWMNGRDYVDPIDVRAVAHDVLRHRLTLTFEAQGEGISADDVTDTLLAKVALT
jgi:MoxR-like ATPase